MKNLLEEQIHGILHGECALCFCTNAYLSRVEKGRLFEEEVASWSNRVAESFKSPGWNANMTEEFDEYNSHSLFTVRGDQNREDLQFYIPTEEARARGVPEDATNIFNITHNAVGSTNVDATLAHSLDPDTREHLREAGRSGRTKEVVRAVLVNLADEGRGLELKAHLD